MINKIMNLTSIGPFVTDVTFGLIFSEGHTLFSLAAAIHVTSHDVLVEHLKVYRPRQGK